MATDGRKGIEVAPSSELEPTLAESNHEKNAKRKPGDGWKEKEVHELPYKCAFYVYTEAFKALTSTSNLYLVFPGYSLLRVRENRSDIFVWDL
jgi:hypothetical protein